MPNPQGRKTLAPPEMLNVQGRGLSPQPLSDATMLSMTSSMRSSSPDDDEDASHTSEEYTVLAGVREMNHMLVRQIETLRLKIQVDEKNGEEDKRKLRDESDKKLTSKETEIEDLQDSLFDRDERIHGLVKAGNEKDKQIKTKSHEIETLKQLVKQSEEYAQKLQKQIGRVISDNGRLEDEPLYRKQKEEMVKLTDELDTLRGRLACMEEELQRAMKIIDMQNEKMKVIVEEKNLIHAKFREDLDRVSKAMRQEVERMREVMRQNFEEMRNLREENKQMHDDVRDIKEMLKATRLSNGPANAGQYETITGIQRPIPHGKDQSRSMRGPGLMVGGNIAQSSSVRYQRNIASRGNSEETNRRFLNRGRENNNNNPSPYSQVKTKSRSNNYGQETRSQTQSDVSNNNHTHSPVRSSLDSYRSNLSPDASSRPMDNRVSGYGTGMGVNRQRTSHHLNVPEQTDGASADAKNFPPICSIKEGTGVGGKKLGARPATKSAVRKGSAVRK